MSTVILSCSSLKDYVNAAQKKQCTNYPVIYIDRKYHMNPEIMKEKIIQEENKMSADIDTVLVAMGFCGGAWNQVSFPRKTVIARVDDCISLLLQKSDGYVPNLKEIGHMYMVEVNPNDFDMVEIAPENSDEFAGIGAEELFHMMFDNYTHLDIVDTGFTDCYSEEYATIAQRKADRMNATLDYVEGSNHLLEKLVSGQWDEQFLVAEAGHLIHHGDFF